MDLRAFALSFVLGVAFCPDISKAQSNQMSSEALSLKGALSLAQSNNSTLKGAREQLREAEIVYAGRFSVVAPTIEGSVSAATKKDAIAVNPSFGGDRYNAYSIGVTATQPIYTGGQTSGALGNVIQQKEIKTVDRSIAERSVTVQILQSFYHLLLAQRRLENVYKSEKIQKELLQTAESRYRIGNEQALAVLQIRTNVALLAPRIAEAENQVRVTATQLASDMGTYQGQTLRIRGSLVAPNWNTVMEAMKNKEQAQRLELTRSELVLDQFKYLRRLELAEHMPKLYGVASYGIVSNKRSEVLDTDRGSWSIGLQLTIPLFSGFTSVIERRVLASQRAQIEIEDRRLRDTLSVDRVRAEENVRYGLTLVSASKNALEQAQEALRVANRTYRLGTATYLQVSDAQQNLLSAELSLEQAHFEAISKMTEYFVAFGWPLDFWVDLLENGSQG